MVLEIWGEKIQPITHAWYLEFWATKLCHTFADDARFIFNTSGHTYTLPQGLNSNPNLTNIYLLFTSALKYESTIGSQGDTTELLHKDSGGSKVGPGRV